MASPILQTKQHRPTPGLIVTSNQARPPSAPLSSRRFKISMFETRQIQRSFPFLLFVIFLRSFQHARSRLPFYYLTSLLSAPWPSLSRQIVTCQARHLPSPIFTLFPLLFFSPRIYFHVTLARALETRPVRSTMIASSSSPSSPPISAHSHRLIFFL